MCCPNVGSAWVESVTAFHVALACLHASQPTCQLYYDVLLKDACSCSVQMCYAAQAPSLLPIISPVTCLGAQPHAHRHSNAKLSQVSEECEQSHKKDHGTCGMGQAGEQ